jgi:diaminopimelate epimerase
MDGIPFIKMHGLGNDFVVLDGRGRSLGLTQEETRRIADRRLGVGCDQLIVIEPPADPRADVFMRIRNADGGEVEACGNAARCIAALVMDEKGGNRAVIETAAGLLDTEIARDGTIAVDMGVPRLDWQDIPLSRPADTLALDLAIGPLNAPVAVNVGNPHAVFFVDDADGIDLEGLGPAIEHHLLFPERTNVEVAAVLSPDRIRLRVWERGAGLTRACGTGACATTVAAVRRGLTGRRVQVILDGGTLSIHWQDDGRVRMAGPAETSFRGTLGPSFLPGQEGDG